MCGVSSTFILIDKGNGLALPHSVGYPLALAVTTIVTSLFLRHMKR